MLHWMDDALCREIGPEPFFSEDAGPTLDVTNAAIRVCRTCPVQTDCLEYALTLGPVVGVWGGTTEKERRRIRSATRRKPMAYAAS